MNTTRISLLLRIKDLKDADAWAEFDAIYRPILSRFAAARGLQEADVDDVVQHCMTAIHAHIKAFEYDRQAPLDAEVVHRREVADYVRETVAFSSTHDERVEIRLTEDGAATDEVLLLG